MSAVKRSAKGPIEAALRAGAPAGVLKVRWSVSLSALAVAPGHGPELREALVRWGGQGADPTLEWTIEKSGGPDTPWVAKASLRGATAVPLFVSNGTTSVGVADDAASGTRNIEVREGTHLLLSAALDLKQGSAMYASTSLLETLGLGGGRYEVAP